MSVMADYIKRQALAVVDQWAAENASAEDPRVLSHLDVAAKDKVWQYLPQEALEAWEFLAAPQREELLRQAAYAASQDDDLSGLDKFTRTVATVGGIASLGALGAAVVGGGAAAGAAGAGGSGAAGGAAAGGAAGAGGGAAAGAAAGAASTMPWWVTAGQLGSSVLGGYLASDAAEDATEAQVQSSREALEFQRESRDIALDLLRPEIEASQTALGRMLDMTGTERPESLTPTTTGFYGGTYPAETPEFDVTTDPGYQFRLDESMRALEGSAAARGNLMSGGFARQALRYAQDYASNEYQNIYNRLAVLANRTPVATNQAATAMNFGGNAANIALNAGEARASGYVAQGNAWQNTMDQLALALGNRFGQT